MSNNLFETIKVEKNLQKQMCIVIAPGTTVLSMGTTTSVKVKIVLHAVMFEAGKVAPVVVVVQLLEVP